LASQVAHENTVKTVTVILALAPPLATCPAGGSTQATPEGPGVEDRHRRHEPDVHTLFGRRLHPASPPTGRPHRDCKPGLTAQEIYVEARLTTTRRSRASPRGVT